MQHMASGKRSLLVSDVSAAVDSFAEAAKIMGEIFGETGPELGETYFYYGKALLQVARAESGVINNVEDTGETI